MTTSTERESVAVVDHPLVARLERVRAVRAAVWAWWALAALLVGTGAGLYHLTRGTTFWFDEWNYILYRRGDGLGAFLQSYNGHFSLIPIAVYRLLFATVGLTDYGPYRLLVIGTLLLCGALVFIYAKRRVGNYLALCAAALILLLGPGWQDMLWPFQFAWLISLASGVGALLLLERRTRSADLAACVLLMLAIASSAVGDVFALGIAVDLLAGRRRLRDLWIVVAPLAIYGIWWIGYQQPQQLSPITEIPRFVANTAAASLAGVAGRGSWSFSGAGAGVLTWGRVLLVIGVAILVWRLIRLKRVPSRALAVITVLVAFWLATALTRASLLGGTQALASRYVYVGGFLIVLLAVELTDGLTVRWPVKLLVGVCVLLVLISNIGTLRNAADGLRETAQITRADLGALQIGRRNVSSNYVTVFIPGFPFIVVKAGPYFAATKALGSPAATPAEIVTYSETAREIADLELARIDGLTLRPTPEASSVGMRPAIVVSGDGRLTARGACVTRAPRTAPVGHAGIVLKLTRSSPGLLLTVRGGSATVAVRRFAVGFVPVGTIPASRPTTLETAPDLVARPWDVQVAGTARITACGLR